MGCNWCGPGRMEIASVVLQSLVCDQESVVAWLLFFVWGIQRLLWPGFLLGLLDRASLTDGLRDPGPPSWEAGEGGRVT